MDGTNTPQMQPLPAPDFDPYAASRDAPGEAAGVRIRHYGPATKFQRFGGLVIDYFAMMIVGVVLMFSVAFLGSEDQTETLILLFEESPLFRVGFAIAYYVLMEGMFGVTVGKLVLGTRVIDKSGAPADWVRVVLRSFARFVPLEWAMLFVTDPEGPRSGHDRWTKTLVVRTRPNSFERVAMGVR